MELSDEEGNFVKLVYIMFNVVQRHLSVYFVKKWDHKYPNEKWHNDVTKRNLKLGSLLKKRSGEQKLNITSQKILKGDEKEWDTTTLISALLDYGFNLIERCRPSSQRSIPLLESEQIEILRSIQTYFTHLSSFSLSLVEFKEKVAKIRNVAKNLFGEDVEREIYKVEVSPTIEMIRMEGKKLHEVFNSWKEDLAELKEKHATIDKLRERFQQLESKLSSLNAKIQHLQVVSIENKGSLKEANQNVKEIGEEMTSTIPQLKIQEVEKEDIRAIDKVSEYISNVMSESF